MVTNTSRCSSSLALVGDKEFLFNFERSAFLMYRDQGRTRVAIGDPVGDEEKFEGLYWRFMEQAQDEGMQTAFYEIGAPMMPVCVEMGLQVHQLGEAAMVPLEAFDTGSPGLEKFRDALHQMDLEGWRFEIWPPAGVTARAGELQAVSDVCLAHIDYLCRHSVAVILVNGRVVAFTIVWPGNGRDELSTDVVRHTPDAPNEAADCLLVKVMLWGKEQGYRRFDLGIAPLSGSEGEPFARLWMDSNGRVGDKGFTFGTTEDWRAWKAAFHPVWEPRYLAISSGASLADAVRDIAVVAPR